MAESKKANDTCGGIDPARADAHQHDVS